MEPLVDPFAISLGKTKTIDINKTLNVYSGKCTAPCMLHITVMVQRTVTIMAKLGTFQSFFLQEFDDGKIDHLDSSPMVVTASPEQ